MPSSALAVALSGCGILQIERIDRQTQENADDIVALSDRVDDNARATAAYLSQVDGRLDALEHGQDVQDRRITRNEQLVGAAFAAAARALEATEANREAMRRMFEEQQRK